MKKLLALLSLVGACLGAPGQPLAAPEIAARNYLLVDVNANQVLAEREADAPVDPAALTKLMTACVAFQALRDQKVTLDQRLPVSARAWDERKGGGALMFLDPKTTPTVDELLQGLVVDAGDDAAVALAEGVGGSVEAFVAMMNRQAQAWGLKNTSFRNVTGLTEPGHRTTARDLLALAQHAVRDYPEHFHYFAQRDFKFNNIQQESRNLLLKRDTSVDGMAAGYTEAGGYSLLASAQREFPNGKRRLLAIVMGADSMQGRANEAQKLLNWGYTAFDDVRLVEAGKPVLTVPVWKGRQSEVGLGSATSIYVAVPKGEGDRLKTRIERTDPLVAPLAQGQRIGTLKISTASGTSIAEVPLTVLEAVPEAGIFGRAWDAVRLWIK
jgi:D-alanyl-D-alanine carboxypeptidase (penicillin-binding protein 5/6)